ncbi:VIT1/CCC1 transporter family protein [Ruania alba]|nr:VIT1/CCC1 transporter family protein [Ruania alba]
MTISANGLGETREDLASRLNWLRAGVLGANDGIVSVAAVVVGVAGVTNSTGPILVAGLAAVLGGAISMALGEYVSVSSQTDSQKALGAEADEVVSPWHAALASALAFLAGSVLPMLAILLPPPAMRVPVTFVAVLVALAITGAVGAWIGRAKAGRAAVRVVVGGGLALAATFAVGSWLGASGVIG